MSTLTHLANCVCISLHLEISDFISLFFQFEIYGKYKFVSTEKRNIFDKFLGRLREKMKEHKIKETS